MNLSHEPGLPQAGLDRQRIALHDVMPAAVGVPLHVVVPVELRDVKLKHFLLLRAERLLKLHDVVRIPVPLFVGKKVDHTGCLLHSVDHPHLEGTVTGQVDEEVEHDGRELVHQYVAHRVKPLDRVEGETRIPQHHLHRVGREAVKDFLLKFGPRDRIESSGGAVVDRDGALPLDAVVAQLGCNDAHEVDDDVDGNEVGTALGVNHDGSKDAACSLDDQASWTVKVINPTRKRILPSSDDNRRPDNGQGQVRGRLEEPLLGQRLREGVRVRV